MAELYAYRARSASGDTKNGNIEADTQHEALRKLQQGGLVVLSVARNRDLSAMMPKKGSFNISLSSGKVTLKDLAVMSRQFSVLYSAGVTIIRTLHTLEKQTQNPKLKDVLARVAKSVESGSGLGESLKKFPEVFPAIMYNMVAAGEVSGSLDTVLDRAANHFDREYEIEAKIKGALVYPKVVTGVMLLVAVFLLIFVVPQFADMFASFGAELPFATRMLIGMGGFMTSFWWLVGIIALAVYAAYRAFKGTPHGRLTMDGLSLKYPVFGELNKKKIVSRFCRSLATLSRSGVAIVPSITLVRQTLDNMVVSEALLPAQEAIRMGQPIAPQLEKCGYFPPLVVQMIAVGEETGGIDVMMEKASDFMDSEIRTMTDTMTQLIEPIIIVVLGIGVAFIILAVVMPMFDTFTLIN